MSGQSWKRLIALVWVLALVMAFGCGGQKPKDAAKKSKGEDKPAITVKTVEREKLLALLDSATTVVFDGKKAEIVAPKEWKTTPALSDSTVMLFATEPLRLPTVSVDVEVFADEKLANLSEDNLAEFVTAIQNRIKQQKAKVIEGDEPLAMLLGGRPCVRYVISERVGFQNARKQVIHTVVEGRMYTVALSVDTKEMLLERRDQAYAIVAGLRFGSDVGGSAAAAKGDAKPESKPEAKPDGKPSP